MFHGNKTGCLILLFWEREGKMTSPADGRLVRSIQVLPVLRDNLFLRYYLLTSLKTIEDNSIKWMRAQTPSTHWTLVIWNGSYFNGNVTIHCVRSGLWLRNRKNLGLGIQMADTSRCVSLKHFYCSLNCSCAFGFGDVVPAGLSWDLNDVQYTQR